MRHLREDCRRNAIAIADEVTISDELCTHCGECAESCVVAHYFDKLAVNQTRKPTGIRKRRTK